MKFPHYSSISGSCSAVPVPLHNVIALTCHICYLYVCVMVLGAHMVLLVLAVLVICVGYNYVKWDAWSAPGAREEWPL